ncbi:MAG: EF-hand domain-containing protein, partial [Candidatus Hydrogenedentota bacterium]
MQKKIWVTILISGLFSIACGFFAFAAPNAQRLARLGSADTDGNNKVSVEEFVKAFPEQDKSSFDNYDKNGDGFLSREDFRRNRGEGAGPAKGARARLLPLLKKADADGNGEGRAADERLFVRLESKKGYVIVSEGAEDKRYHATSKLIQIEDACDLGADRAHEGEL